MTYVCHILLTLLFIPFIYVADSGLHTQARLWLSITKMTDEEESDEKYVVKGNLHKILIVIAASAIPALFLYESPSLIPIILSIGGLVLFFRTIFDAAFPAAN
jgi:hypothetical protein